ncbi:podocalyxin [Anolis sagrei]|uniref:podocalyxin n=1 Tax=Anolis sagrei TaxID=38937 RepID=UPI00352008A3
MRRGHATRPAMRPPPPRLSLLLLMLLLASSCPGDASTASAGTTKSGPTAAATTVKPSLAPSGSPASSTLQPTTSKALLATTASMTTVKSVPSSTTKETQKTTLGASTRAPTTSASAGIKPPSSSVSSKTMGATSITTASKLPTVPPTSSPAGPKGTSPSILPSSDSSGKGTTRPPPTSSLKSTLSAVVAKVPTTPGATTSHRPTTAPGHGSGVVPPGSATTTKEKTTGLPTVSVVTTTMKPGPISPKGSAPTTATKHEGKIESATTLVPLGAPTPTPDSSHTAAGTTGAATHSPKHHPPSPPSGTIHAPFQAQTKVVCEKAMPSEYPGIILTFNESTPCSSLEGSPLKEPLLHELCRAVKSSFNRSRDDCTGSFASISDDPKKLAILRVSVTTHSEDDKLSESLIIGELEKLGLTNLTYGGKPLDNGDDPFSLPLIITIVCMAASLLLVAAIYGCCHQRISRRKDQQRLTEELQTMENGYHDNPTLEVMETSAEMQEKKVNLNGELADSWIVPMDSLTKEDLEEEEDTHL